MNPASTLTDPQRIIADLQRKIADLQESLDEAQAREAAAAEVLHVINASPGDLVPVFDAMLGKAMRLCGAAFGILRNHDGERYHTVATNGVPSAYAEFLADNPQRAAAGSTNLSTFRRWHGLRPVPCLPRNRLRAAGPIYRE